MSFQRPTDNSLIGQALAPVSASSGAQNGAVIDTTDYEGVTFILEVGVMATNATLDMKIQRSVAAAFSPAVDIAGAALVQVTYTAGGSKTYIITVPAPSARYVRCVCTPAAAASVMAVTYVLYGKRGTRPATAAATQQVEVAPGL
jgi:hypothetical protein